MSESRKKSDVVGKGDPRDASRPTIRDKASKVSRRDFVKTAAVTTLAFSATAGLAKAVSTLSLAEDHQKKYLEDVLPGDRELAKREYVEMTNKEKKDLVKGLVSSYSYDRKS